MKKKFFKNVFLSTMLLAGFSACDDDNDTAKQTYFEGEQVTLGNGKVTSFAETDAKGTVVKLGFAISEAAMNSLPEEGMHEFSLDLPSQASQTEFQHLTLDWNAHGHEPDDIYTLPHFDFHFYTITETYRHGINPESEDMEELPDLKYIPDGYFATPGGIPMMGKHWLDSEAPELNGEEFTYTFIYGSYDAEVIFLEPMITKAQLTGSDKNKSYAIKQPASYKDSSKLHPRATETVYDAGRKEYRIFLKDWE